MWYIGMRGLVGFVVLMVQASFWLLYYFGMVAWLFLVYSVQALVWLHRATVYTWKRRPDSEIQKSSVSIKAAPGPRDYNLPD